MTDLLKPIKRRTKLPFGHYRKKIIVQLEPGDIISMKLERSRTWYTAPLDDVFLTLAQWHANARRKERRLSRKFGK